MQELGLQTAYCSDDATHRFIQKLMVFPFLPHPENRPMFVPPTFRQSPSAILLTTSRSSGWGHHLHPKRLECLQATHSPDQQRYSQAWHNALNRRAGGQCRLQFYLCNRTSSSRSPLNFNNNQACLRQEVKENTKKEVQATPTETTDAAPGMGAVQDRQQECVTITPLLFPPEWTRS